MNLLLSAFICVLYFQSIANETGRRAIYQRTDVAPSIYFTVTEAYTG